MTKILSVNAGSSSLKFKLLNMPEESVIAEGLIERIGGSLDQDDNVTIKFNGEKHKSRQAFKNHEDAINLMLSQFKKFGIVNNFNEIKGIGHRVVAGGEWFNKSVLINDEVLNKIERLAAYAPLHNPANAMGIRAFSKIIPDATEVAVFDTAFHQTMPKENYLYAVPYEYYTKYGVRRYGAHGTSHKYVSEQAAKLIGKPLEELKLITLHLGAGASVTAIKNGRSFDTSMGFSPLAGLVMATRSGDVDVSLIDYVKAKEDISDQEMLNVLNQKSGLLGVSTISSDMRDLLDVYDTNDHAKLAIDMFVGRVVDYIGQYYFELKGADALVFTAGIGENSVPIRKMIIDRLAFLGIKLDEDANDKHGVETKITTDDSKMAAYVIPTNEELEIARDVQNLMK
ncbi:acetate kinase [Oenococcus oeni]|uniref:acetate/propionate family kinase n=1 Tax=Oenococcus oeni TaxID=1247 RepID=UPI000277B7B8|nr:acetate kinase [Oenococcus oeni]EJO06311.1 acetate kinase [Oenococcus oeni AWRIB553]EKP89042.1 acetate kinase [Oenococcus oeni DSM 20252 = AWRIB129]KGH53543.1 acetate kinase [Oenococcus oeni IOEB_S277]KGH56269.1 acetate kinase [Oenococcus oeni IOEB_B10]KGH69272.1 acetate kinase [Oenococcus oeni IOEB_9517]